MIIVEFGSTPHRFGQCIHLRGDYIIELVTPAIGPNESKKLTAY